MHHGVIEDEGHAEMPTETFKAPFDPASESVVEAIAIAVASIKNTDPTRLPPLGESIDGECLERLFAPGIGESVRSAHVTFDYAGVIVTVDQSGEIRLELQA